MLEGESFSVLRPGHLRRGPSLVCPEFIPTETDAMTTTRELNSGPAIGRLVMGSRHLGNHALRRRVFYRDQSRCILPDRPPPFALNGERLDSPCAHAPRPWKSHIESARSTLAAGRPSFAGTAGPSTPAIISMLGWFSPAQRPTAKKGIINSRFIKHPFTATTEGESCFEVLSGCRRKSTLAT